LSHLGKGYFELSASDPHRPVPMPWECPAARILKTPAVPRMSLSAPRPLQFDSQATLSHPQTCCSFARKPAGCPCLCSGRPLPVSPAMSVFPANPASACERWPRYRPFASPTDLSGWMAGNFDTIAASGLKPTLADYISMRSQH
jgi:hypothetical protein